MPRIASRTTLQYFIAVYVAVSCLYCFLKVIGGPSFLLLPNILLPSKRYSPSSNANVLEHTRNWSKDILQWTASKHSFFEQAHTKRHTTSESRFLSKAFDSSMQPNKVIPFYFRAIGTNGRGSFQKKDISILTIVTSNRFHVLGRLAQRYQGR